MFSAVFRFLVTAQTSLAHFTKTGLWFVGLSLVIAFQVPFADEAKSEEASLENTSSDGARSVETLPSSLEATSPEVKKPSLASEDEDELSTKATLSSFDHDKEIKRLRRLSRFSCRARGGVDCAMGPNEDGKVICKDGFDETRQSWKRRCTQTRLKIISAEALENDFEFEVSLRNETEIPAKGILVSGRLKGHLQFEASGPQVIEPWGLENYKFRLETPITNVPPAMRKVRFKILCENCPLSLNRSIKLD